MPVPWSSLILFVHVAAAMVLVGSSLVAPLVLEALRSAATVEELRRWLAFARRSARANPVAALALLATGIYCGRHGWWSAGWFWVAIGAWALNSFLAAAVAKPAAARLALAALAAPPGPIPPDVHALRRLTAFAHAQRTIAVNDLVVLFLMLDKPSWLTSLALLAGANAIAFAVAYARSRATLAREKVAPSPLHAATMAD